MSELCTEILTPSVSGGLSGLLPTRSSSRILRASSSQFSLCAGSSAQLASCAIEPKTTERSSKKATKKKLANRTDSKRRKLEILTTTKPKCVYFVPFDEPSRPVLVDTLVLGEYQCRSALVVKNESAPMCFDGVPAYHSSMSRTMLVAFLKSLTHHEFIVPSGTTYHEAMRTFEYEGIAVPCGDAVQSTEFKLDTVPFGIGMACREEKAAVALTRVATLVSSAILEWPRLDIGLRAALRGTEAEFTCTHLRAWVRFADLQNLERSAGDDLYHLAKKRHHWLQLTLKAIGLIHAKLCAKGILQVEARDERSFTTLARNGIDTDSARFFLSTKCDFSHTSREIVRESGSRDIIRHAERFAASAMQTVAEYGPARPSMPPISIPIGVKYARACISLAERLVRQTPDCASLFSSRCAVPTPPRPAPPPRRPAAPVPQCHTTLTPTFRTKPTLPARRRNETCLKQSSEATASESYAGATTRTRLPISSNRSFSHPVLNRRPRRPVHLSCSTSPTPCSNSSIWQLCDS